MNHRPESRKPFASNNKGNTFSHIKNPATSLGRLAFLQFWLKIHDCDCLLSATVRDLQSPLSCALISIPSVFFSNFSTLQIWLRDYRLRPSLRTVLASSFSL